MQCLTGWLAETDERRHSDAEPVELACWLDSCVWILHHPDLLTEFRVHSRYWTAANLLLENTWLETTYTPD